MGRSPGQTGVRSKSKSSLQRCQSDEPDEQTPSPQSCDDAMALSDVSQEELQQKRKLDLEEEEEEDVTESPANAHTSTLSQASRPKRRATNAHIIRFLQTRNPNKLEEEDLKRALEASLEEHPDFWQTEETASCSSSDQSNAPSASSNSSSTGGGGGLGNGVSNHRNHQTPHTNATNTTNRRGRPKASSARSKRSSQLSSSAMQQNHLISNICNCQHMQASNSNSNNSNNINYNNNHPNSNCAQIAITNRCPMSTVHNRYKPVTKKNIYSESDFFHDGIMEYIEYELQQRGLLD